MLPALRHIDCWIFDLDNSLYPASTNLFELIDIRMGRFIQELLGCDAEEARRVQKGYFHEHGTTLAGLMKAHGTDPRTFLDYVHDIDLARITADPRVVDALDRLPGRKFVFTNGDERYAGRVLDRLGLANAFDGLHDIHAMDYVPKPDPRAYAAMCARFEIVPTSALFVEDMARNLIPAKALGMCTVWVDNGSEQAGREAHPAFIDYRTADIGEWLTDIVKEEHP
ncbi:pyrimidine 5'-nucleotidase [Sphingosinicella sp. BN140058]|uniref:pyrimidine 5'-nucleotidase n=1 Tax=Sphingosinicella sp. BN140058 TaxID=1892855 RepID=UPI0010136A5E|nr:pyrimidine 5'-nucleotidase [Sphingosinicella sp. BN140058]QAY76959.1 pyrimidine 5'-nucleotidase [Sphingosinicella sp. BN140058]